MCEKSDEKELIKKLKNSPLYVMSLSEKELFHSNFWAWLFERNLKYAEVFFNGISAKLGIDYVVTREEGNRDITIWNDKSGEGRMAYVVENKLKSIPNKEQLEKYTEKLDEKFCAGCLTGFVKLPDIPNNWTFVTYREIGNHILSITKIEEDSFEKNLIQQYANMIICLQDVLENTDYMKQDVFFGNIPEGDELKSLRLNDLVAKLNASKFVSKLEEHRKELKSFIPQRYIDSNRVDVIIGQYFSNGTALIDVKYKYIVGDDSKKPWENEAIRIGIQIQGDAYKRLLEMQVRQLGEVKDVKDCCEQIFKKGSESGWFEKDDIKPQGDFTKSTSMRGEYNRYQSKSIGSMESNFVYQYKIVENKSFEALIPQILDDAKIAAKILVKLIEEKN